MIVGFFCQSFQSLKFFFDFIMKNDKKTLQHIKNTHYHQILNFYLKKFSYYFTTWKKGTFS